MDKFEDEAYAVSIHDCARYAYPRVARIDLALIGHECIGFASVIVAGMVNMLA